MIREALIGAAAGAVGTVALNATTYVDMALRGRAASSVPSEIAGKLTEKAGIDLSAEDEGPEGETAQNRKSGLGALSGYVVGLGVGTAYGVVRPHLGEVPIPLAGLGLALVAMAGADVPAAVLGVTAPTTWPVSTWVMDLGFHLPYGLVTAVAYEAFNGAS
ncbi:MAG: hypothetical protein M3N45_12875 [Actinomycetota bacterium]|nr:hypothetical protein [Actinomycetota bacterium]